MRQSNLQSDCRSMLQNKAKRAWRGLPRTDDGAIAAASSPVRGECRADPAVQVSFYEPDFHGARHGAGFRSYAHGVSRFCCLEFSQRHLDQLATADGVLLHIAGDLALEKRADGVKNALVLRAQIMEVANLKVGEDDQRSSAERVAFWGAGCIFKKGLPAIGSWRPFRSDGRCNR